jgi:hypothetical protein
MAIVYQVERYAHGAELAAFVSSELRAESVEFTVRNAIFAMVAGADIDEAPKRYAELCGEWERQWAQTGGLIGTTGLYLDPAVTHPSQKPARVIVSLRNAADSAEA